MRFFQRNDPDLEEDLQRLEAQLRSALQPVSLNPEFVSGLRARLMSGDFPPPRRILPYRLSNILLIAGGVIGSILMVIASIRGFAVVVQLIQRLRVNSRGREPTPA